MIGAIKHLAKCRHRIHFNCIACNYIQTVAYTSREVTKWGTFSAVISNELVTYTEGDKIVVFYK